MNFKVNVLLMVLSILQILSMENEMPKCKLSNYEIKIQPGDYREVMEPFWTFPQRMIKKGLYFKVLGMHGKMITAKINTTEEPFFMHKDDLMNKTKKYWLKEPNTDLLLKNRHYIVDYLILKEIVKLGLTNKEIFRILFPDFPNITKIAGIEISPKIREHLKYFANLPMLELTFWDDTVSKIWKSHIINHDPFGFSGRCGIYDEIYINNKVTKIIKFDFHHGAIVAVGDNGQKGIVWKSEFFNVANSFEKIKKELEDMQSIVFTDHAFAILNNQNKLHVFGDEKYGGTLPEELKDKDVHDIESTHGAFAATLWETRDVIVWGLESAGGAPSEEVRRTLKGIYLISSTRSAFLAESINEETIVWGDEQYGGNPSDEIKNQLKNNKGNANTLGAFTVITSDGNFISWGHGYYGADPSEEIKQKLKEIGDYRLIRGVYTNNGEFTVTLDNGDHPIAWGNVDDLWENENHERHLRPKRIQLEEIKY